jgi:hypothetical protein
MAISAKQQFLDVLDREHATTMTRFVERSPRGARQGEQGLSWQ